MWLVDSQCGIVGILLNFHMWTGMKNFRPESGVKFFIHENFHTWNRCEFSIRHVQPYSTCEILNLHTFQTCFWCESGMKQAWSYENILYGCTSQRFTNMLDAKYKINFQIKVLLTLADNYTYDSYISNMSRHLDDHHATTILARKIRCILLMQFWNKVLSIKLK